MAIVEERLTRAEFNTDPIAYWAAARPHKSAVVELANGGRLNYAELSELADRAAGWIAEQIGAPAGERIAYLGRNGLELLALALGAERCGAIFVPLNWRLAPPEIGALLADCGPKLVVAQEEVRPLLGGTKAVTDALEQIRGTAPRQFSRLDAGRPIIILYTSGTTGQPKGVIVTADNAFAAGLNFISVGDVAATTVAMSDLPMFHVIGLVTMARSTLMSGGTLVLSDRFIPARTLGALADPALGITHYFAVPVMAEALARDPAFTPSALQRLDAIFLGGAPLAPALIERFLDMGVPLVNGYGMSECGTAIHVPVDPEVVRRSGGAVGLPAPHIAVRLVRDGRDVPDGEVGEVWVRGPSVSPGYWKRPQETVVAFADGWYRSGDLARREPDGMYRLVDRLKDMYVSGGENVFPAEVEAVLAAHAAVADAAVLGVPDTQWGETGLAFVVARDGHFESKELRAHCLARLAKYKCPARFVAIDAIPRSAAGKILKQVLRERLNSGEFQ
jgi:fatty-acyl-CoA synthase